MPNIQWSKIAIESFVRESLVEVKELDHRTGLLRMESIGVEVELVGNDLHALLFHFPECLITGHLGLLVQLLASILLIKEK